MKAQARDDKSLVLRSLASGEFDSRFGNAERFAEQRNDGLIRFALLRRRGDGDAQCTFAFAENRVFREAMIEWEKVIALDPDGELGRTASENVRMIKQYVEADKAKP